MQVLIHIATGILICCYHLGALLPHRRRWVCLSRQSDTVPVDFALIRDYMAEHHPEIEVVILARRLETREILYPFHMLRQAYQIGRSEAVILDSFCIVVSLLGERIKAPVIQMWHAMGNMKKFGFTAIGTEEGSSERLARLFHMHEGYDSVLISSLSFIDDYVAGFHISKDIVYEAPLPRADLFIEDDHIAAEREHILAACPQLGERQNVVYAPTFRKEASANEAVAMEALISAFDFENYNLIFKPHPNSTQRFSDSRVLQDYPDDLEMLYIADYVISDYSTVIYEAGLLHAPVYLYAYDWDTYSSKRSFNIDIEHDVPVLFTADPAEILTAIEHGDFDAAAYEDFMRRNIALPPSGTCTQRIVEQVLDMVASAHREETGR